MSHRQPTPLLHRLCHKYLELKYNSLSFGIQIIFTSLLKSSYKSDKPNIRVRI